MIVRLFLALALLLPVHAGPKGEPPQESAKARAVVEFDRTGIIDEHYEGADENTPFVWGSVSKSVAATLVLMLDDENLLDVNEPVTTYFPEFIGTEFGRNGATVAQLITHTSGLPRDFSLRNPPKTDTVDAVARLDSVDEPGTFDYSNVGYQVLQHLVERTTGTTYDEALNSRVPELIGSGPFIADVDTYNRSISPGRAPLLGTTLSVMPRTTADGFGYGSLSGTPRQLALWGAWQLRQHQHGGSPSTFPRADGYGAGLIYSRVDGKSVVEHDGVSVGYYTQMIFSPDTGRGVVILTNELDLLSPSDRKAELAHIAVTAEEDPLASIPFRQLFLAANFAYWVALLTLLRFSRRLINRRGAVFSLTLALAGLACAWGACYGFPAVQGYPTPLYDISYSISPEMIISAWISLALSLAVTIVAIGWWAAKSRRTATSTGAPPQ